MLEFFPINIMSFFAPIIRLWRLYQPFYTIKNCDDLHMVFIINDAVYEFCRNEPINYIDVVFDIKSKECNDLYNNISVKRLENPFYSMCLAMYIMMLVDLQEDTSENLTKLTHKYVTEFADKNTINIEMLGDGQHFNYLKYYARKCVFELETPIEMRNKIIEKIEQYIIVEEHKSIHEAISRCNNYHRSIDLNGKSIDVVRWELGKIGAMRSHVEYRFCKNRVKQSKIQMISVPIQTNAILGLLITNLKKGDYDIRKLVFKITKKFTIKKTKKYGYNVNLSYRCIIDEEYERNLDTIIHMVEVIFVKHIGKEAVALICDNLRTVIDSTTWEIIENYLLIQFRYITNYSEIAEFGLVKYLVNEHIGKKELNSVEEITSKVNQYHENRSIFLKSMKSANAADKMSLIPSIHNLGQNLQVTKKIICPDRFIDYDTYILLIFYEGFLF